MGPRELLAPLVSSGIRWGGALTTEVLLLPRTLREFREAVGVMGTLPTHIERLAAGLDTTTATLDEHIPELSRTVVGGIDQRVVELAGTVDSFSVQLDRLAATLEGALPPLTGLPPQLDRFDRTVDELATQVTALSEQLGEVLPKLSSVVGEELPRRVEHLDEVVSELSATLTAVLGSIPGVRRSVRTPS